MDDRGTGSQLDAPACPPPARSLRLPGPPGGGAQASTASKSPPLACTPNPTAANCLTSKPSHTLCYQYAGRPSCPRRTRTWAQHDPRLHKGGTASKHHTCCTHAFTHCTSNAFNTCTDCHCYIQVHAVSQHCCMCTPPVHLMCSTPPKQGRSSHTYVSNPTPTTPPCPCSPPTTLPPTTPPPPSDMDTTTYCPVRPVCPRMVPSIHTIPSTHAPCPLLPVPNTFAHVCFYATNALHAARPCHHSPRHPTGAPLPSSCTSPCWSAAPPL